MFTMKSVIKGAVWNQKYSTSSSCLAERIAHNHMEHMYMHAQKQALVHMHAFVLCTYSILNYLQVGDDHLQMPSWSGAILPGWRVYPCFVRRRQVATSVGGQRDTRRATYKDYDWSARLHHVGPGDMEQPSRQTEDLNSVHWDICKKKLKSHLFGCERLWGLCLIGAI